MSYEKGENLNCLIDDKNGNKYSQEVKDGVANTVIFAFYKMFLTDKFLHVDLHPGNMLLQNIGPKQKIKRWDNEKSDYEYVDGYKPTIVILDCGLAYQIIDRDGKQMQDMFQGFLDCGLRSCY